MPNWLTGYEAVRVLPRLWVETLWLVESREPFVLTRTVDLHPGLNVVWARESASGEASGLSSAGHGVGKTSLCLLLRYVLGDDTPAINMLRNKAAGSFPKGGVAAKVHVDGVAWIVFRPYGAYSQSMAARCNALDQLFQGKIANDFGGYNDALERFSIGRLAAPSLPGTNQPLRWQHLLAWCIRDQRTRFDGFYHWRDGEGTGFTRPRRDPPLFVSSVLGLVDAELDRLLREIEATQVRAEKAKERIPELERAPVYALAHADHQLRLRVQAQEDEPVFLTTVGESVESRVLSALKAAEQDEHRWAVELALAEEQLAGEQVRLVSLRDAQRLAELDRDIAKSLVDANQADFERLTKSRDELEGLGGRCDHGDVEFSQCQHIQKRKSAINMTWHRDAREVRAAAPERAQRYAARKDDFEKVSKAATEQSQRVSDKKAELHRLRVRVATSESSRTFLKQSWDEYQLRHAQRAQGTDNRELVHARAQLGELEATLNSLRAAAISRRSLQSARVDALKSLTAAVSTRLLGATGHARFVSGHELRPFEVSRGGEAYQVLEVLLGDIVCLLDSVISEASSHPGFLVHDCPREADMSERLYREFFLAASEAAKQLGNEDAAPFQFIVTTTSPPPAELASAPHVVLELAAGAEESLFFRRQLAPELAGFELL